jgi:hypothetical protein
MLFYFVDLFIFTNLLKIYFLLFNYLYLYNLFLLFYFIKLLDLMYTFLCNYFLHLFLVVSQLYEYVYIIIFTRYGTRVEVPRGIMTPTI